MAATARTQKYPLPPMVTYISVAFLAIGLATFGAGLGSDPKRIWPAYLTAFFFFATLSVGGLFFTAVLHVTKAGWGATVRRLTEAFASFLPVVGIGALILLAGSGHLYEWLHPEVVAADRLLQLKAPYLNKGFFYFRTVAFVGLWILFGWKLTSNSLKQDNTGDEKLTHSSLAWSIAFMLVFALSYSLFSVDTLMSLSPHWFSTIFGVYCFAGLFQVTMAFGVLFISNLVRTGAMKEYINENHLHDVAKLMFAFTVFYAYIGFSQFMLIWYANMPEETSYFLQRSQGTWMAISMSLLVFKFIVPFLALMPRWAKRSPAHASAVAILLIVMEYVDIYWMVYPNFFENHPVFSFWEIGMFLGFLGAFMIVVTRFLKKHSFIPLKDPRLHETAHHHI
ncbi:MAG: molybdopterin oxidoreductase [Bdellovibrionia bacterium]